MIEAQRKLEQAARYLQQEQATECQRICNDLLNANPGLLPALHLRGLASAQKGMHAEAARDLSRVWPAERGNLHAALWLGRMHRLLGEYDEARVALAAACNEPSLEIDARYELARVLTRSRQSEAAIEEYRRLLDLKPGHADAAANLAFLLERVNSLEEAQDWAEKALRLSPQNFMAMLTLATLQRRDGSPDKALGILERCLQQPLSPLNRSIVLNQTGQCLLKQNAYPEAFRAFEQSNTLLRQHHPLGQPVADGSYGIATLNHLRDWLEKNPPSGWSSPVSYEGIQPVFLVGFPRSGTTLLDQALSAHPDIEVLEEHEFLDMARRQWVDGGQLERLSRMNPVEVRNARDQYLEAVNSRRQTSGRPVVVDKLPLNLAYLFLIHRLFPRARILFMLRDPRDACLSCFFQSFDLQGAMPYFLDLSDTTEYYDTVMQLASLSLDSIGNPVKLQRYENLVTDLEASMRDILEFLNLGWNDEVLNYREKARNRVIDTPSYQQVVQPLYSDAINRWRHFSEQMEPHQQKLGQWISKFGYPDE